MKCVLVAVSVATLLARTSGADLPAADALSSNDTTLVHAGHHADIVLTDQGFQLTRVKKQSQDESNPVVIRYNADVPSAEDQRVRRQLQQGGNAIGQPTVQFFRDVGSFNREIQRLFGSIHGQTATGATAGGNTALGGGSTQQATFNSIPGSVATTSAASGAANTPGILNFNTGISLTESNKKNAVGRGSTRQATVNSIPSAVATTSAASGAANTAGILNFSTGISLTESNKKVALERSKINKNTGNRQVTLNTLGNNNLGAPISAVTASQGSNKAGSSNNVKQQAVGSFDSQKLGVQNKGSQVVAKNLNSGITIDKSVQSSLISNSVDTSINTPNQRINTASTDATRSSNINAEALRSSIPQVSSVNRENIGSFATQPKPNLARPLNIITNFPTHSIDTTNYPVILLGPNDISSVFGLNNQISHKTSKTGVNTEQNSNIASEGVASAGIRRLKERIRNPTNQSPREIFLEELAKSGIASPLQASVDNSVSNNFGAQSFANTGGGNQVNNEQNSANVNNQGQSSIAEQTQLKGLQSLQTPLAGQNLAIGRIQNQIGLPSQQQLPIFGQGNANQDNKGIGFGALQNLIAIPVHVDQAGNILFNPDYTGIPSHFIGGPQLEQNQLQNKNVAGLSQRQTQQSFTGPNTNRQTNQISSVDNSNANDFRAQSFANIGGGNQINDESNPVNVNNQRQSSISEQIQVPGLGSPNTLLAGQNTGRPTQTAFIGGPQVAQNQLRSISFAGLPQRQTQQNFAGLPQSQTQQNSAGLPQSQKQSFAGPNNNKQTIRITSSPLVTIQPTFRAQNQPGTPSNQSPRFNTQGQVNNLNLGFSRGNINQNNQKSNVQTNLQSGGYEYLPPSSGTVGSVANSFHQGSENNQQGFTGLNSQVNTHSTVNNAQFALGNFPQVSPSSINLIRRFLSQQHNTQSSTSPVIVSGGQSSGSLFFTPKGPPKWGFFSNRFCNPPHRCKVVSDFGIFNPIRK